MGEAEVLAEVMALVSSRKPPSRPVQRRAKRSA
jgi:hypothetical protein